MKLKNKTNQEKDKKNKKIAIKKRGLNLLLILNEIKEWGMKLKNKINQEKNKKLVIKRTGIKSVINIKWNKRMRD